MSHWRRWTFTSLLLATAIVILAGGAGWMLRNRPSSDRADADNTQQIARGAAVYQQHCASCHGANLEGQTNWRVREADGRLPAPPHDETGHTWRHPDEQLFRITEAGLVPPLAPEGYQSDMPAFGSVLTAEKIWAVLAFIKSKWPDEIRIRRSRPGQKEKWR